MMIYDVLWVSVGLRDEYRFCKQIDSDAVATMHDSMIAVRIIHRLWIAFIPCGLSVAESRGLDRMVLGQ